MNVVRIHLSFPSLSLFQPVEIEIALPGPFAQAKRPFRPVWLLHCALEGGNFFFESLNAGELVEKHQLALIAPTLGNGYFINNAQNRLGDFLKEIKKTLPDMLPLSVAKKDNAVLGISMGAFGALRWALDTGGFGAVACISGVYDCSIPPDPRIKTHKNLRTLYKSLDKTMRYCLLDQNGITKPDADFTRLAASYSEEKPDLFFYCGDEDYLSLPQTAVIQNRLAEAGFKCQYFLQKGSHDSSCWRLAMHAAVAELFKSL